MPPSVVEKPPAVVKPNPRNNSTMFQIFHNVQFNVVQHKKYLKEMTKLSKKLDEDAFRESFKNALHYVFTFGDTSANVDRIIQFVATFCTTLDDEEEFLLFIFEIIFDCQCVSGQSVRYRASQLLAAVLSALGADAMLDDNLCDKLLASQLERLQDTRGAVRCRAALALQRLQNPMEADDPVTRAYRFHLSCDPSSSVRRAVVMAMAKCIRNVPFVMNRLCDVDEAVRRAAFLYIASMKVTQLTIKQRMMTLKVGLTERSQRVRRVVEEILIPSWLSMYKGNIIDLLKAVRLDNAKDAKDMQYVTGKLLESLFKRLPVSELLEWLPTDRTLRLIPAEKLNKDTARYWRHLAEHLQKIGEDDTLESVIPELAVLTGYIRAIVESPCPSEKDDPVGFGTRQYVLHELGSMVQVYDATDPAGRAALKSLIEDVLTGDQGPLSSDVIRVFVNAMDLVLPDVEQRIASVCQIVSGLRDPDPEPEPEPVAPPLPVERAEVKMRKVKLRLSLNVAKEALDDAVKEQNYELAAECKARVEKIVKMIDELTVTVTPPPPSPTATIKEKVSDPAILTKCLTILNCALDTPQLKTVTPMLRIIYNVFETDLLTNPDIEEPALQTLALYGMLDKKFVNDNKAFFFTKLVDSSDESVVCTVLKCIVDLLCVHGARVFEDDASEPKKSEVDISESAIALSQGHTPIIEILLSFMDNPVAAYRLIVVEGFCRMMYLGHLESPTVLSRLLLLWFNPATAEEDMLRQTIGVFFQVFPTSVDGAQDQIQKATLPILRALANAPASSPLAEIDQEAVVKFIVSLTRVNHELADSQGAMAMMLCSYLISNETASEVGLICRLLALLSPPRHASVSSDLATMLRDLAQKLSDKQSCRNLARYLGALEAAERTSLNKISNTGVTEGTLQQEDTLSTLGHASTSMPKPIARSTHVVINETIEEEVQIDETSPTEVISRISEELPEPTETSNPSSIRNSSDSVAEQTPKQVVKDSNASDSSSDSSGVSPVKRPKVPRNIKNKQSLKKPTLAKSANEPRRGEENRNKKQKDEDNDKGGVKGNRSPKSVSDVDKAKSKAKKRSKPSPVHSPASSPASSPPLEDVDVANVTGRKSTRGLHSGSGTDSNGDGNGKKTTKQKKQEKVDKGKAPKPPARVTRASSLSNCSQSSLLVDSADETELHTIVYDGEFEQSLLEDSGHESRLITKANVTIPETPDPSDESETEPEPVKALKGKGKKK